MMIADNPIAAERLRDAMISLDFVPTDMASIFTAKVSVEHLAVISGALALEGYGLDSPEAKLCLWQGVATQFMFWISGGGAG